jgi:hypothetical protein
MSDQPNSRVSFDEETYPTPSVTVSRNSSLSGWLVLHSKGYIKTSTQANLLLLGVVVGALVISMLLFNISQVDDTYVDPMTGTVSKIR